MASFRNTTDTNDLWHPPGETNQTAQIYPKTAHKNIHKIKKYLTPEERNYWWKLTHKIISVKKTESKYKRDQSDNLVSAECPLCHHPEETRQHYEYDCPTLSRFRHQIAHYLGKRELTHAEWMLETPQPLETTILIAKARWAFHCARCNVDHNRHKELNLEVVLNRTHRRVKMATETNQNDTATPTN